jgi:hypothetical protein
LASLPDPASLAPYDAKWEDEKAWCLRNERTLRSWAKGLRSYRLPRLVDVEHATKWFVFRAWLLHLAHPSLLALRLRCAWLAMRLDLRVMRWRLKDAMTGDALFILVLGLLLILTFALLLLVM